MTRFCAVLTLAALVRMAAPPAVRGTKVVARATIEAVRVVACGFEQRDVQRETVDCIIGIIEAEGQR